MQPARGSSNERPATKDTYPGTRGRTQGDMKETTPATKVSNTPTPAISGTILPPYPTGVLFIGASGRHEPWGMPYSLRRPTAAIQAIDPPSRRTAEYTVVRHRSIPVPALTMPAPSYRGAVAVAAKSALATRMFSLKTSSHGASGGESFSRLLQISMAFGSSSARWASAEPR